MKRSTLLVLLIVFLVFATLFLALIWTDMRNSRENQSPQSSADHRTRRDERRSQESTRVPHQREDHGEACTDVGITCASQYFAAWTWPADGSCRVQLHGGYPEPDPRCTPGGVVPGVTAEILRNPAWRTSCIRNCQSSEAQKRATYAWYGLPHPVNNAGQSQICELDHLVPLELGGADGMGNIWPECGPGDVALRERYFKEKDLVENYLASRVRAGDLPIGEAQHGIASDWVQYLAAAKQAGGERRLHSSTRSQMSDLQ